MKKLAVVTGANRGLGFETCRQLAQRDIQVILTSRDAAKGQAAAEELQGSQLDVKYHQLDVTNPESVEKLAQFIARDFGHLDILVNNAGILLDLVDWAKNPSESIFDAKVDTLLKTIETNVCGSLLMCQSLIPLMKTQNYGRVVNLASNQGQFSGNLASTRFPTYGISKVAVNAVTFLFANALKGTNILVNSVFPGWVKTTMGGSNANLTVEEGVETIVWAATLPDDGPTGELFYEKKPMSW
jgi:NAD(P)-dependent dehydrogenase (short-subunit alcohol dehydrogenase family)